MYYKIHPPFCETVEQEIEHNQTLAYLAQLDTLLLEFEHSEEFRACSPNYLDTPRIILEDFIHETHLALEFFDAESLVHGLFTVIPARVTSLVQEDANQIIREQISFWAFVSAQWQFHHAQECLSCLNTQTLEKLHKIINLGDINTARNVPLREVESTFLQPSQNDWTPQTLQEQDVISL